MLSINIMESMRSLCSMKSIWGKDAENVELPKCVENSGNVEDVESVNNLTVGKDDSDEEQARAVNIVSNVLHERK